MDRGELQALLSVVIALLCGSLIGLERQFSHEPAGLRTHMLVAAGAALFMAASVLGFTSPEGTHVTSDRIAAGIVTGIGFLGAGSIWRSEKAVHGLTTAASIWVTAAIGVLAGSSHYFLAASTTILAVITLRVVKWVETKSPLREIDADKPRD